MKVNEIYEVLDFNKKKVEYEVVIKAIRESEIDVDADEVYDGYVVPLGIVALDKKHFLERIEKGEIRKKGEIVYD